VPASVSLMILSYHQEVEIWVDIGHTPQHCSGLNHVRLALEVRLE